MQQYLKFAICGEFRAGKDKVAEYLHDKYGFSRVAFAAPLKSAFHMIYPHIPAVPKPRAGYQHFGQACKVIDPLVWIRPTLREAKAAAEFQPVVITDLRQPDEHAALMEAGFTIIKVIAPEALRIERAIAAGDDFTPETLTHETERLIAGMYAHYSINNQYDLDTLYAAVDVIVKQALRKAGGDQA